MPTRDHAPLGAPAWIDLSSSDIDRAQEFYGAVFGWAFEPAGPDYGGYVNAVKDGRPVAGLMPKQPQSTCEGSATASAAAPDAWATYFHSADIDTTVAAVARAGGRICVGPMQVKDKGWMAVATDSTGGFFGLWQPIDHQGFEVIDEAGAPVWHQLTTQDYGEALRFYREVFGWETRSESDTDDFRYTTAAFDGEQLLGVMDGANILPAGVPSHWTVFLGADDVDKTLQLVTDNGGQVLRPAENTPYGRLAAATDPAGAMFNLSSLR